VEAPSPVERECILAGLRAYNVGQAGPPDHRPLCVALRNAAGEMEGGLWGVTMYDWLFIELLFIPERLRGGALGREVMARAEEEARGRGCIGAWLDTFSFQARGFYEKLGYEVTGTIPDHPRDGARYIMSKRLRA